LAVYFDKGVALAVTTTSSPAAPTVVPVGSALLLFISSNTAAVTNISDTPATAAGYTLLGSTTGGGGLVGKLYGKYPAGPADNLAAVAFTGITGGTKGVAQTVAYVPNSGGVLTLAGGSMGADTNTTTSAFAVTGSSATSRTYSPNDLIYCYYDAITPANTYSAAMLTVTLTQAGATIGTATSRLGGLSGTNTLSFGLSDAAVTAGGTGAPSVSGTITTATGATAGGVAAFVFIQETPNPIIVLAPRR
jgi:hypothetical protein